MGTNGTTNTGGGGGGSERNGGGDTNGGSGIVIFRYPSNFNNISTIGAGLTYTLTTANGYKIYTFTAGTGTITI
jgi:hypothetical protein